MKKAIKVGKEETESSIGTKTFACTLAGKHISVKSDIMKIVVSILSSTFVATLAKIKLIFLNSAAGIIGNTVELNDTSAGNHCLRKQW